MSSTVIVIGSVCIVAAIVGGGLELAGAKIPLVGSRSRQLLLAAFGALLLFTQWSNWLGSEAPARDEPIARLSRSPNVDGEHGSPQATPPVSRVKQVLASADGRPAGRFWRDGEKSFVEYDETNTIVHEYNIVERGRDELTLHDKSTNDWVRMDFSAWAISTKANSQAPFVRTRKIEKVDWTY